MIQKFLCEQRTLSHVAGGNESSCSLWRVTLFPLNNSPWSSFLLYQPFLFSRQTSWKDCLHLLSSFPYPSLDHTNLVSAFIIPLKCLSLRSPVGIFHLHLPAFWSSSSWSIFLLWLLILYSLNFRFDLSEDWSTPLHSFLSAFLPLLCFFKVGAFQDPCSLNFVFSLVKSLLRLKFQWTGIYDLSPDLYWF